MSLTFYFSPMSTASITNLVFAELDIPHERVRVDIRGGGSKKPEYLKIDPNGRVPVIVHDGSVIWESSAITMYLGEMFGVDKKLYPAPGPKRGEAMKWICWSNVTLGDAVYRYTRNAMEWMPADERNAKAGESGKKEVAKCLGILNEALTDRQFLVGEYTLADTHVNSLIDWLRHMQIDMADFSALNAWSERCKARPAYAKAAAQEK